MTIETVKELISQEIEKLENKNKGRAYIQGNVVGMIKAFKVMGIEISSETTLELLDEID